MVEEHRLSRVRACKAVGLSRSALYKPTTDRAAKDAPVIQAINEVLEKRPRWGFWKCFERLHQDGRGWNHKRVYRVYCAMRLNLQRKVRRRVLTRERQPLLASTELNRVWALDFMRDTLYDGRPFRTLNVIDEGNREALRIECGTSIPSARVVLLDVLEVLTGLAARRAAANMGIGRNRGLFADATRRLVEADGTSLDQALDRRANFYQAMFNAAASDELDRAMPTWRAHLFRNQFYALYTRADVRAMKAEYRRISDAILGGDSAAAGSQTRRHFRKTRERVLPHLR